MEKKKVIGKRVICTGIIGNEAFEKFDLPKETLVGSLRKIRFYSPHGNSFDYEPGHDLAKIVDRDAFNQALAKQAEDFGTEIYASRQVESVEVEKDQVKVLTTGKNSESQTFRAKAVILSTGVNYKLFSQLGLKAPKHFIGGAQISISCPPDEERASIFTGKKVAPGGFGWYVPTRTGVARVGLISEETPIMYLKKILDRVLPDWRDRYSDADMDVKPIAQSSIKKSFLDRVLVVGEAAGQIKTTTGGGIYYGLLGANLAVETLETAFKENRFTAKALSVYDKRWKKMLGDELRFGYLCRKFFTKLSDNRIEKIFDRVMNQELTKVAYKEARFDWHKGVLLSIMKLPRFQRFFKIPFLR